MSRWEMVRRKTYRVMTVVLVAIIVADLVAGGLMQKDPKVDPEKKENVSMADQFNDAKLILRVAYLIREGFTPEAAWAVIGNMYVTEGNIPNNQNGAKEEVPQKASTLSDTKGDAGRQNQTAEESKLLAEYEALIELGYAPHAAVEKAAQLWVDGELPAQHPVLEPVAEVIPEMENEEEKEEEKEKTVTVELLTAKTANDAQAQVATAEEVLRELEKSGRIGEITKQSTTSDRIWWIFKFLVGEGFTPESAAAVIGNVAIECCFDPTVIGSLGYYGLFQWNNCSGGGYWWTDILVWLTENGYEWDSFEGQMKAFLYCSNRGFLTDSRLEKLKGMINVEEAVEYFCVFYEGCVGGTTPTTYYNKGTCYQGLDSRKSEAWVAYYMYVNGSMDYTGFKWYTAP